MPVFTYKGTDAQGKSISGQREADNKAHLQNLLRRERITAKAIKEKGKEFNLPTFGTNKVATKDIAIFFRQFSRSEERRVGKSVDVGGRRIIKKKKKIR